MRWLKWAVPAIVLAAWLAVAFAQQGQPPANTPPPSAPPAGRPPAGTPPPAAPPEEQKDDAAPPAKKDEESDVFVPTEELQPDAAVTFPVDI